MMMLSIRLWLKAQAVLFFLLGTVTTTGQKQQQQPQQQQEQRRRFLQQRRSSSTSVLRTITENNDNKEDPLLASNESEEVVVFEDDDNNDDHHPVVSVQTRRNLQGDDTFASRLSVDYTLTGNANIPIGDIIENEVDLEIIQPVLDELIATYNRINDVDPLERRLVAADIVSGSIEALSGPLGGNNRHNQRRLIFGFRAELDLVGRCNGCRRDAALTNQITPGGRERNKRQRELIMTTTPPTTTEQQEGTTVKTTGRRPRGGGSTTSKQQRTLQSGKGKGKGSSEEEPRETTPRPVAIPIQTPNPTKAPTPRPTPAPTVDPDLFLPTEEELLTAYSVVVMALNDDVIRDVADLEEVSITCPSSSANTINRGMTVLTEAVLLNCRPLSTPGFLVLDIDQPGTFCLETPNNRVTENLWLQPCNFNRGRSISLNRQAWTIDSDEEGVFRIRSAINPTRCIQAGNNPGDPLWGARLTLGLCANIPPTQFQFDFEQNYLQIAGEEEAFCVSNAGVSANPRDTVNARSCPGHFEDDDDFQWLFLFDQ